MRGPCGWIAPYIDHYSLLNGALHIQNTLEDGAHTYVLRDPNKHVVTCRYYSRRRQSIVDRKDCIAKPRTTDAAVCTVFIRYRWPTPERSGCPFMVRDSRQDQTHATLLGWHAATSSLG